MVDTFLRPTSRQGTYPTKTVCMQLCLTYLSGKFSESCSNFGLSSGHILGAICRDYDGNDRQATYDLGRSSFAFNVACSLRVQFISNRLLSTSKDNVIRNEDGNLACFAHRGREADLPGPQQCTGQKGKGTTPNCP